MTKQNMQYGNDTLGRDRGFFDSLNQTLQSPLFLGGAALMSGEGFGGMAQGMRMGHQIQNQERKREAEIQQQQQFQGMLQDPNISKHLPPTLTPLLQSMGPGEGAKAVMQFLKPQAQPASVKEFKFAKRNGFQGSYTDWKNQGSGGGVDFGKTGDIVQGPNGLYGGQICCRWDGTIKPASQLMAKAFHPLEQQSLAIR